jgi:hypothetical protein
MLHASPHRAPFNCSSQSGWAGPRWPHRRRPVARRPLEAPNLPSRTARWPRAAAKPAHCAAPAARHGARSDRDAAWAQIQAALTNHPGAGPQARERSLGWRRQPARGQHETVRAPPGTPARRQAPSMNGWSASGTLRLPPSGRPMAAWPIRTSLGGQLVEDACHEPPANCRAPGSPGSGLPARRGLPRQLTLVAGLTRSVDQRVGWRAADRGGQAGAELERTVPPLLAWRTSRPPASRCDGGSDRRRLAGLLAAGPSGSRGAGDGRPRTAA